MTNELTVINKLRDVIAGSLNSYLTDLPSISAKNVMIDFPDVDQMPMDTMFYIIPDRADYENLSVLSDSSALSVAVFILCKRDRQSNLTKKIYGYFNAMYELLRNNLSLDTTVDFCEVASSEFYPAVEANKNVQGIEATLAIRYTKDF